MTDQEAYARVSQHFTGIIAGLSAEDQLLVAEHAIRRAQDMLNRSRERAAAERKEVAFS